MVASPPSSALPGTFSPLGRREGALPALEEEMAGGTGEGGRGGACGAAGPEFAKTALQEATLGVHYGYNGQCHDGHRQQVTG